MRKRARPKYKLPCFGSTEEMAIHIRTHSNIDVNAHSHASHNIMLWILHARYITQWNTIVERWEYSCTCCLTLIFKVIIFQKKEECNICVFIAEKKGSVRCVNVGRHFVYTVPNIRAVDRIVLFLIIIMVNTIECNKWDVNWHNGTVYYYINHRKPMITGNDSRSHSDNGIGNSIWCSWFMLHMKSNPSVCMSRI